jgi:hypothetical protein
MATLTLSNVGEPEAVHVGVNAKICRVSLSVTVSAGDIHIIGRIPHGAIPLDAIFYMGAAVGGISTGPSFKFGTSASQELFFASASYSVASSALNRCTRLLGTARQISLSDDAMPRYENIVMVSNAGGAGVGSVGHQGDLVVFYKMPGQSF